MIKIHMKKVAFIGRNFGEAFAIVVESLNMNLGLGHMTSFDLGGSFVLVWPQSSKLFELLVVQFMKSHVPS